MGLPKGADLLFRLNIDDQSGKLIPLLDQIAASALEMIRGLTELTFPPVVITGETPFVASYNATVVTDSWPVTVITAARLFDQPLRVGTLAQLYTDKADIAIARKGEGVELAQRFWQIDQRGLLSVDYTAGLTDLPADLLEVWGQIGMLLYNETTRSGISEETISRNTVKFTRELPDYITAALGRYRRYQMP